MCRCIGGSTVHTAALCFLLIPLEYFILVIRATCHYCLLYKLNKLNEFYLFRAWLVLLVVRRGIVVTFEVLRGEITDCMAKELVNL